MGKADFLTSQSSQQGVTAFSKTVLKCLIKRLNARVHQEVPVTTQCSREGISAAPEEDV